MRFVRGRELKDVLDMARRGEEGWTRTKVLAVVVKVCEAMAYAHSKGVVHRDLKPSNVMVGRFGETYVMDWGLARVLGRRDSHDLRLRPEPGDASAMSLVRTVRRDETSFNPESPLITMDGDVIGTPSYMAPEQARGKLEEVGAHSDVYSLGAILYYMLTGQAPYVKPGERLSPHTVLTRVLEGGPTPVEKLVPDEPAELVAICEKAMSRVPEQRYLSMLEVADDIQAYVENRVVRAYERGAIAEFRKWVARNKGMAAGIAGMLTLSIVSALGFAWQQQQQVNRLTAKESETRQAKDLAELNEARARESEQLAQKNAELANQGRVDADHAAAVARASEAQALRSGYVANMLAADFSLKLNDLTEARERLRATQANLRGWEWKHLNHRANGAVLRTLGSFPGVEALGFLPRAERVVLLSSQGRVYIKDLATLQDVPPTNIQLTLQTKASVGGVLQTTLSLVSSLAMDVSSDGTRIALVGRDSAVHVYDLETGDRVPGIEVSGIPGHVGDATAVAFSPDGRLLASGDDDGQVIVRDAWTWEDRRRMPGHIGAITQLAWSPDSTRLASASRDGSVRVRDLESRVDVQLRGHRGAVTGIAWDLAGQLLFSAGEDGAVNEWEVESGRLLRNLAGHTGPVLCIDYDPNHARLVTGSSDTTVRVWDLESGTAVVLSGHVTAVRHVAFGPAGDLVLSSGEDGTVYLWDTAGDLATTELALHRGPVNTVTFDATGKHLVSASDDHDLLLWDSETAEPLRRLRGHDSMVRSAVYSPDGRAILSASQDKTVRLWDAETGRLIKVFSGFDKWLEGALFTPDGSRVIVAAGDKKLHVLDASTTEGLRELSGFKYAVERIALGPGGKTLAAVARDILFWDLSGPEPRALDTLRGRFESVAFSPDGTRVATGSSSGLVQLWELDGHKLLATHQDYDNQVQVHAMAFSPDGRRLVSGASSGVIHVRDGESGDPLLALEAGSDVRSLAFDPEGARLAAGLAQGGIRIFETSSAAERRTVRREAELLREEARSLVDALFATRFFADEVVLEIESNLQLERPLKETALRVAHLRGDDPAPLFVRSLQECLDAEHEQSSYALALDRARAAERIMKTPERELPADLEALSRLALGAASYRNARYSEAENYLLPDLPQQRDPNAERDFGRRERALRLLFLCMSQCQVSRGPDVERNWRLAQQSVMSDADLSLRPELLGLLTETETLIRSRSTPAGS